MGFRYILKIDCMYICTHINMCVYINIIICILYIILQITYNYISCLCIYNFSKFGRIEIVPKNPDLWLLEKSDDFAT